jgi:hypothetical protein
MEEFYGDQIFPIPLLGYTLEVPSTFIKKMFLQKLRRYRNCVFMNIHP